MRGFGGWLRRVAGRSGRLEILRLAPGTAHLWFGVGPAPDDREDAIAAVAGLLGGGGVGVPLLVVARRGDTVVGRIEAMLTFGERLDVCRPTVHEGLTARDRQVVAAALLDDVLAAASHPAVRFVEVRVSEGEGHAAWLAVATARGFHLAAAAHVYVRELGDRGVWPPAHPADLTWHDLAEDDASLVRLFRSTHAGTSDRVLRDADETPEAQLDRIEHHPALDHGTIRRLACHSSGANVGLLILGRERGPLGDPANGWILTIGTAPAARGRGIGAAMLRHAMEMTADAGATRLLARIDDENVASIRLHEAAGFVARPEIHRTLWWRAP